MGTACLVPREMLKPQHEKIRALFEEYSRHWRVLIRQSTPVSGAGARYDSRGKRGKNDGGDEHCFRHLHSPLTVWPVPCGLYLG